MFTYAAAAIAMHYAIVAEHQRRMESQRLRDALDRQQAEVDELRRTADKAGAIDGEFTVVNDIPQLEHSQ